MSKVKVNFSKNPTSLDGSKVEGVTLGQVLASFLSETNEGDSIRLIAFARELWGKKGTEVDKDVLEQVKKMVEADSCPVKNLFRAQILEVIAEVNLKDTKEE
jgi:hypothetical protein